MMAKWSSLSLLGAFFLGGHLGCLQSLGVLGHQKVGDVWHVDLLFCGCGCLSALPSWFSSWLLHFSFGFGKGRSFLLHFRRHLGEKGCPSDLNVKEKTFLPLWVIILCGSEWKDNIYKISFGRKNINFVYGFAFVSTSGPVPKALCCFYSWETFLTQFFHAVEVTLCLYVKV